MKIAIGSDHAGFLYKEKIRDFLEDLGHSVTDFGTHSEEPVDYPLFIAPVASAVARHAAVPSPHSEIHFHHFGGAVARVGDDETAFGNRSAQYVTNVIARSPSADGFDANVAWARGTTEALAPVSRKGVYTNFMGDAGDSRLRASYGEAKYE